jgi:RNA polymerase sigma factor (sigma-70 family)
MWLDQESDGEENDQPSLMNSLADPSSCHADERDERLLLADALGRLPENLAQLVHMRYFEDQTQAEIARRFDISQMEVCRRLRKAEKALRAVIQAPTA